VKLPLSSLATRKITKRRAANGGEKIRDAKEMIGNQMVIQNTLLAPTEKIWLAEGLDAKAPPTTVVALETRKSHETEVAAYQNRNAQ
jgi:hypothetical protein